MCRETFKLHPSVLGTAEVCDKGNVITFRSTGGEILNEFSGKRVELERVNGVYRADGRHVGEGEVWDWWHQYADGFRARQCGGRRGATRVTWKRACLVD